MCIDVEWINVVQRKWLITAAAAAAAALSRIYHVLYFSLKCQAILQAPIFFLKFIVYSVCVFAASGLYARARDIYDSIYIFSSSPSPLYIYRQSRRTCLMTPRIVYYNAGSSVLATCAGSLPLAHLIASVVAWPNRARSIRMCCVLRLWM